MKNQFKFSLLILGSFLLDPTLAEAQKNLDALGQFIEGHRQENNNPGIAVGIVKDSAVLWEKGFGFSNIASETPMTTKTIGNVGSVAKTITATAIMQLWEQNLVQLDTDITTYLPISVKNPHFPKTPITIRQLLTHTSSIIDNKNYGESYSCGDSDVSLQSWLTNYFEDAPTAFNNNQPGKNYEYSNVGYGLLGAIVENVSGKPFNEYCKMYIFTPLKMTQTGWFFHEINSKNHMTPYLYASQELDNLHPELQKLLISKEIKVNENNALCLYGFANYPDGLLRTSINDLSNFLIALLNGGRYSGKQLLKKETLELMLTSETSVDKKQGLCWRFTGMENIWGHGGDDLGIQAGIYFNPDLKIGMICLKNNNMGSRTEILRELYLTAKKL